MPDPPTVSDFVGAAVALADLSTECRPHAAPPPVFIRDSLSDFGAAGASGSLSASPDIIVRGDPLPAPAAALRDAAVDPGSEPVRIGRDNYVYVRVHNRGERPAETAVRVYQTPLTTVCAPADRTLIGEKPAVWLPAGGMTVTGPFVWPRAADPGTTCHFCFIASWQGGADAAVEPGPVDSAAGYLRWARNGARQACRNVVFEDVRPNGWLQVPFLMHGFGRLEERFELEIDAQDLPRGRRVQVQLDSELPSGDGAAVARGLAPLGDERDGNFEMLRTPKAVLGDLRIASKARTARIMLSVRLPEAAAPGQYYELAAIQKWKGRVLGRVTINARRRP